LLSGLVRLDADNHYTFFTDSAEDLETLPPEVKMRLVRTTAPTAVAAASDGHRSPGDMWRMGRAMSAPSYDILLFPTVYSYVPVFSRAKKVVIIHDVIAEKYPHLTLPSRSARLFWKAKTAIGRWQADAIVTVSDFSRLGIVEHFRIAPERVFVVGEASDPVFRVLDNPQLTPHLQSLGINPDGRTVIYVGGFGPHKNLEMLVTVFASLAAHQEFSDVRLVMVGEYKKEVFHSQSGTINEQIQRHGITDRVIFTGFLPDEELVILLNSATVLVLPSLMEGFGLPAVEAAACGCPVIATTASPLPELLGDGGCYVDPTQPKELESELNRVLKSDSLRQHMRQAGLTAASQLTWDAAARQMMGVIHQVTSK
jgi:glycosyltransferase involved in cell wall biosynthesis